MADVTTYRRCIASYAAGSTVHTVGDLRASTDPVVTANPNYWVSLGDTDFTAQRAKWH